VVGYTAEDVPLDRGQGRHGVFLRQEIPLGGKLARSREVEERRVERARIDAETGLLAAQTRLRLLYGRILAAQETIAVRTRLAALGQEAVEVTRQLYNTGVADTPDLLAIEDDASLLAAAAADAGFEREALWGELQAVVADPDVTPGRLAGDLYVDLPHLDEAEWRARIHRESPALRRAAGAVAEAESALARERSVRRPDLELEGALRKDRPSSGSGFDAGWEASADLGVRLPLWNRNQGAIAAATAELDRARLEARRAELAAEAGFATGWARYRQATARARTYREGLLDRARRAHRLYLEKYRQMTAAYPQVLVAERTLRQLEDDAIAAAAQAWDAAARIEGLLVEPRDAAAAMGEPARP
jgi:cobalt-zinc-cadmium efflux system outer membrane protein